MTANKTQPPPRSPADEQRSSASTGYLNAFVAARDAGHAATSASVGVSRLPTNADTQVEIARA
ncbi:MAG: hypothetical protein O2921_03545 [Chloroflexi bacterium]|nr:hypothetical protein [Chloroflexota bacterium]